MNPSATIIFATPSGLYVDGLSLPGSAHMISSMLDWKQCSAVEQTKGKVGGAWLFKGSRVPVQALFENLEDGATLDEFLDWFPGVTRGHARMVLEFAEQSLAVP